MYRDRYDDERRPRSGAQEKVDLRGDAAVLLEGPRRSSAGYHPAGPQYSSGEHRTSQTYRLTPLSTPPTQQQQQQQQPFPPQQQQQQQQAPRQQPNYYQNQQPNQQPQYYNNNNNSNNNNNNSNQQQQQYMPRPVRQETPHQYPQQNRDVPPPQRQPQPQPQPQPQQRSTGTGIGLVSGQGGGSVGLPTFASLMMASPPSNVDETASVASSAMKKGPRPVMPPANAPMVRIPSTANMSQMLASGRDDPTVELPAKKYVFNPQRAQWREVDTVLRVPHPNRGLGQGGMRACFEVDELEPNGVSSFMVAKMFRHHIEEAAELDYFREAEAQCLCTEFLDGFERFENRSRRYSSTSATTTLSFRQREEELLSSKPVLTFLQCNVVRVLDECIPPEYRGARRGFFSYRTTDTDRLLFVMEPKMTGTFTKYTNNYGDVYTSNETYISAESDRVRRRILDTVEAFSHYTLIASESTMLVCDLQGVYDCLTDPQIHTDDGVGLGMGNMGMDGIYLWADGHRCNEVCRRMGLEDVNKFLNRLEAERLLEPDVFEHRRRRNRFWQLVENLRAAQSGNTVNVYREPPPQPASPMTSSQPNGERAYRPRSAAQQEFASTKERQDYLAMLNRNTVEL